MDTFELGSRYRTVRIGAGTMLYSKNSTTRLELPNGLIQRRLALRLSGNLVVGTANAAAIFAEAPLGLIKKVELIGDTRRTIVTADARMLWNVGRLLNRAYLELAAPSGTVGTRAFSALIPLDAEALQFMDPSESMLDTRLFKKLELVVTWGSETDIATAGGGGGTITIDAATNLDVLAMETAEGVGKILFDHVLTEEVAFVTASSTKFTGFDKIPQSGLLSGILLRTTRDAGAGAGPVPVDDIINNITLRSDVSIVHVDKAKWRTLQSENVKQFLVTGGDATTKQVVGYAYLDLTENGMFSSALNINALNQAKIELDVTRTSGTEEIKLMYDFFEPRRTLTQEIPAAA